MNKHARGRWRSEEVVSFLLPPCGSCRSNPDHLRAASRLIIVHIVGICCAKREVRTNTCLVHAETIYRRGGKEEKGRRNPGVGAGDGLAGAGRVPYFCLGKERLILRA